jgi:Holliday junction resolvase RusA-like endonuclease
VKGEVLLPKVQVRGFTPRTYGEDDIPKKAQVRDLLKEKIPNLSALQSATRGKRLWVEVVFYLYAGTTVQSRTDKDIDNLLKIVVDALPEFMDKKKMHEGLGIILEDKDDMVFEVHARKVLVNTEAGEGIDIEIAEWLRD